MYTSFVFTFRNSGSREVETWRDLKPSMQWNSFERLMKRKLYNVVGRNTPGADDEFCAWGRKIVV
jgi:hypothetical protein